jgi:hypothetical protein
VAKTRRKDIVGEARPTGHDALREYGVRPRVLNLTKASRPDDHRVEGESHEES